MQLRTLFITALILFHAAGAWAVPPSAGKCPAQGGEAAHAETATQVAQAMTQQHDCCPEAGQAATPDCSPDCQLECAAPASAVIPPATATGNRLSADLAPAMRPALRLPPHTSKLLRPPRSLN